MNELPPKPLTHLDEEAALRMILEGTATHTGEAFFRSLVHSLAKALSVQGAWVTEYYQKERRLRAMAFFMGGEWIEDFEYDIDGTPCEVVVDRKEMLHIPDNILALYPGDSDLEQFNAVSLLGFPLLSPQNEVYGHLAVLDSRPMPPDERALAIFKIFAARATAELQRIRAEEETRVREQQLGRLVDGAIDAIVELDEALHVCLLNPAGEAMFGCSKGAMIGTQFADVLSDAGAEKLRTLAARVQLDPAGSGGVWIPGGLEVRTLSGRTFPAEATLSRSAKSDGMYYTLILRDVNDRIEAERLIGKLSAETDYLRRELQAAARFDGIIGESAALQGVLHDIAQVAATDATVLILGETGTGKEVIARAIHGSSARAGKPLVKVNCAAIPAALMESEFFGHEKGAFTGATDRREGRFTLADGGTIFLDEVGELSPDLQAKLLRVLQEGEFEPVGSSKTRRVDVRVVAATNRDLEEQVKSGAFREDLFYRLNVFPITIPPLRERGDDVVLLASVFAQRFARRMGRTIAPLSEACARRLKAYSWPGNVRELENVIERAVITAKDGRLNLDRALPEAAETPEAVVAADGPQRVFTANELLELERQNIRRALEACGWKVAGAGGAAELLGMKPSTLSSRIKALGITRV